MADDPYTCTWCREVIAGEGRAARVVVVQKRRREGGEGGREGGMRMRGGKARTGREGEID